MGLFDYFRPRMATHNHTHFHYGNEAVLKQINKTLKKIMATQEEVAGQLAALTAQVEKVKTEIQANLDALAEAIAAQGNATPEVEAALAALTASVQGADDLNPDAPVQV